MTCTRFGIYNPYSGLESLPWLVQESIHLNSKYSFLGLKLESVAEQCLILSNIVEPEFPGQLWCCTSCKKDGMMSSNTREDTWRKQHKNCRLFMGSTLTIKTWGRSPTNLDRMPYNLYGFPKDLKKSVVVAKKRWNHLRALYKDWESLI